MATATGTIRGRVLAPDDSPIQGAWIRVSPDLDARTDDDGRFVVRGVPPGRKSIRIVMVGFEPWHDSIDVAENATAEREVRLALARVLYDVFTHLGHPRPVEADTAPATKEYWDAIVRGLSIEPLRVVRRNRKAREIRLWLPPNLTATGWLVRLLSNGRSVRAELYTVWALDTLHDPRHLAYYITPDELIRLGCDDIRQRQLSRLTDTVVAGGCTIPLRRANWRRLLQRMEEQNVWTLPDESEITRTTGVSATDANGFIAEVLDGPRYHTYQYWAPELYGNPETKNAKAILSLIDSVIVARRKPIRVP